MADSVIYLVLTGVVTCLMWFLLKHRTTIGQIIRTRRVAKMLPYNPPHWLVGNFDQITDFVSTQTVYQELTEKHNRMFIFWSSAIRPVLTLVHPETIKGILKSSEPKTYSLGAGYRLLDDWIGDGLLLSRGQKWERNRRLLTPAFHFAILKSYQKHTNSSVKTFLDKMSSESIEKDFVEVYTHVSLLTLEVMLKCAFSFEDPIQLEGKSHPYVEAMHLLSELVINRAMNPLNMLDLIYKLTAKGKKWKKTCDFVHNFSATVIEKRRKTLTECSDIVNGRHLDFLDILLTAKDEEGLGLSDKEIRDEVDTFLFEGHDTTASAASWALYALANYPNEQEKVYREVDNVLGNRKEIEWDDLAKLNQTRLFLKEVLRYFSPVYQIGRQITQPCVIDGYEIPVGMCVDINIINVNHNPSVWDNHDIFDSTRFESEDVERDPFMFVPFSAGPRNCIGQNFAMNELKSLIALTVQRFHLEIKPTHEYIPMPCVVMRSKYGIPIKFSPRN